MSTIREIDDLQRKAAMQMSPEVDQRCARYAMARPVSSPPRASTAASRVA